MFSDHERGMRCWDWDKNAGVDPMKLTRGSGKKIWLICDVCEHSFQSLVHLITNDYWCGFCAGRKFCDDKNCKTCLKKSFASHPKSKHWVKEKNDKTPRQVAVSSNKKFWFHCEDCGHDILKPLNAVSSNGSWCEYCASKTLCTDENCVSCREKSMASHKKSKYWSSLNKKTARQTFKGSSGKVWFDCKCGHTFSSTPDKISIGRWCSYCSSPPQKLCNKKDCERCFNNSFASSDKAEFWSPKNKKSARQTFKKITNKCWFNCTCGSEFSISLYNISRGQWCPCCSKKSKTLCDRKDCMNCHNRSMASHQSSQFWSKDNDKPARKVRLYSYYKAKLTCEQGHDFEMSVTNISFGGQWCPLCKKKGEKKLYEFLIKQTYSISREKKFDWCKNLKTNKYFRFDFKIKNGYKVLVELDGKQHFQQVKNWQSHTHTQARDLLKMKLANENGYAVIRITWEMIWRDKSDWQSKLINAIETINWASREFICENNEYDVYQNGEITAEDELELEDEDSGEDAESELEEEEDELEEEEDELEEEEDELEEEEDELED